MRTSVWFAATGLGLVLAMPACAQIVNFGRVNPTQIVNQPVTVPDNTVPIAQPMNLGDRTFTLASFLPKIMLPSASPVRGQSNFPTAAQMPGKNYLKAFGFQRPAPVAP